MKSFPFAICAMLAISAPAFCQQSKPISNTKTKTECIQAQGEPLTCYTAAYNAPAEIWVHPKDWNGAGVTAFIDASFTYWYAGEEGLRIASTGVSNSGMFYYAPVTQTFTQSFNYKPGFKVGLGLISNHEWTFHAEYTWFRGKNTSSSQTLSDSSLTAGTTAAASGIDVWVVDDWFLQGTDTGQALSGPSVSSSWRLRMDLIDAVIGRPFYQSARGTVSPFAGLQAAFIRQTMNVQLTELPGIFAALSPQPIQSRNHSNSWAIGPKVGASGKYLCSSGFYLESDAAFSLLYTRYTSIKHSEDIASSAFNPGPYTASLNHYSCLRPAAELGLGLGWGTYFCDRDYHIDFSATYDFMIFWSQNMMRKLLDDTLTGTSPSAADLYLHGLTVSSRFDF